MMKSLLLWTLASKTEEGVIDLHTVLVSDAAAVSSRRQFFAMDQARDKGYCTKP